MVEFVEFSVETPVYAESCALRDAVLRRPVGLNLFEEDLSQEKDHWHFGLIDEKLVASVLFVPLNLEECPTAKLRQMCVDPERSGQGLGSTLVRSAEEVIKSRGIKRVIMAARVSAQNFYERLGYFPVSEVYMELGIPHITLEKCWSEKVLPARGTTSGVSG